MSMINITKLVAISIIASLLMFTGCSRTGAFLGGAAVGALIVAAYDHPRYRDRPYYHWHGKYYYGGTYLRNGCYRYKGDTLCGGRYYNYWR